MTRLWFSRALLPDGWAEAVRIVVADGLIAEVQADVRPTPDDEPWQRIALPGLPNVHSHTFQRAMAGLAEHRAGTGRDDFWSWRETMYRIANRLGPDDVEAVAALAFAEMLESGFTRVGEFHYLHHDLQGRPYDDPAELAVRVVAAALMTGIGLTLLPVFYAHAGFGGTHPTPEQRRFVNDFDRYVRLVESSRRTAADVPGTIVGTAPHSLRAVAPDELGAVVAAAGTGPVHVHVAEQVREVNDCLAWSGQRPLEWLLEHAPVDPRWCLIHATHATAAEFDAIAGRGAVVGLCPITEANLGDGIFDARTFRAAGGEFGVGTDSNVLIDAAGELRQLEYSQRLSLQSRNVLAEDHGSARSTGRSLFQTALRGGSQALGTPGAGLAVGQPADIVALDPEHQAMIGREGDAWLDGWIFAARSNAVADVWARGRHVVSEGRHRDHELIEARFRASLTKILG